MIEIIMLSVSDPEFVADSNGITLHSKAVLNMNLSEIIPPYYHLGGLYFVCDTSSIKKISGNTLIQVVSWFNLPNKLPALGYACVLTIKYCSKKNLCIYVISQCGVCVSKFVKPPVNKTIMFFQTAPRYQLATCAIQKNMATIQWTLFCFLKDPAKFVASNRTITSSKKWDGRSLFCFLHVRYEDVGMEETVACCEIALSPLCH